MNFQEAIKTWAPGYMLERWCGTLLEAVGMTLDASAERVQLGRLASDVFRCEPDVLPRHSRDRGIQLYASEPLESKRYRLSRWHQLHQRRGTHLGEMQHMQPYFLPGVLPRVRIVHQDSSGSSATWWTMNPNGVPERYVKTPSNFNYDGRPAKWSRWMAFVEMAGTSYTGPPLYDDGHDYDDGTLYDVGSPGGISVQAATDIAAMFTDWKAAHSWCVGVVLVWPPATLDPTATPTQDADGRWSLPNGANTWSVLRDPATGLPTRPYGYQWIYDHPSP